MGTDTKRRKKREYKLYGQCPMCRLVKAITAQEVSTQHGKYLVYCKSTHCHWEAPGVYERDGLRFLRVENQADARS